MLSCLTWGSPDDTRRPLAVLLHGFPDTAHTWRHVAPMLVEGGYRVVAPFTRGYAPSPIPPDGSYHVPALMADALALHDEYDGDGRAVLVGHDWGAITANGIAASSANPYGAIVALAVPPLSAMNPRPGELGRWARILPRQARNSWYTVFNQLPRLPERSFDRLVAHLWRKWSPGYDATEDLRLLRESMPDQAHKAAAIGYYRAQGRPWQLPALYQPLATTWMDQPRVPVLVMLGADDGCLDPRWASQIGDQLPDGSVVAVVEGAGHFLQLEQPERVGRLILEHLGTVTSRPAAR